MGCRGPGRRVEIQTGEEPDGGSITVSQYFFGAVDANRIAMETGDHVILNPPQSGAPLSYFMYPYAEADGKPLNEDLYGFNIGYKITFKEL